MISRSTLGLVVLIALHRPLYAGVATGNDLLEGLAESVCYLSFLQ